MSAINVNSITGRTGSHGPVLTGVTTAVGSYHVTGAGSSVGIGTDDPTYKLDIRVTGPEAGMRVYNPDSSALASGMLRLGNDTNANSAFLQLNGSNNTTAVGGPDALVLGHGLQRQVHLSSGGVSRLTVDVGGNIGIGTTDPDRQFHLESSLASTQYQPVARFETTSTGDFGPAIELTNNRNSNVSTAWIGIDAASTGGSNFVYASDGSHRWLGNDKASERMRVDLDGRLLIGSSSARTSGIGTQANLYVVSPAVAGTASTVYVAKFQGNSSVADSQALISCSAGYPISANDSEGHVHFGARREGSGNQGAFIVKTGTTQTERLRVNSNGYVKASDDLNDANFLNLNSTYHAFANGRNGNIVFLTEHYGTNNPSSYYAYFSQASPDNNTAYFLTCQDSTTTRVRIWSDGDLDNHDNSYGAISDVKLKQDIVDAGSQWDDLKNLRVRKFKFKTDVNAYGDQAKTLIGLIAQEAETVCPGLVKETDDVGNDGLPNGETTKAIRYSVLYMKAIKALQEAQTRIETLEARVAALEGN